MQHREARALRWWFAPEVERVREIAPDRLDALVRAIERSEASAGDPELACLKRGRRKALYRTRAAGGGALLVKLNRYVDGVPRARRLRASKARRELEIARRLRQRGIETPLPLAAGEARRAGQLERCALVVREIAGAVDLERAWREGLAPRERREAIRELGALAQRLHSAGLDQRDFAPNNLLRVPGTGWVPIDFERARLARRIPERRRCEMLAQLESRLAGLSRADCWRALLAYCGGDASRAHALRVPLAAARQRIARRELAHWQRTVLRGGRRFEALARGAWRGFGLRGHPALAEIDPDRSGAPAGLEVRVLGRGTPARAFGAAHWLYERGIHAQPIACLAAGSELRLWTLPTRAVAAGSEGTREWRRLRSRLGEWLGSVPELPPDQWLLETLPDRRTRALLCAPPEVLL